MKIAIDARWIFEEMSGIPVYTRELIRQLAILDRENSYCLLFDNPAIRDRIVAETETGDVPNFSTHLLDYGVFSIKGQLLLPALLARDQIDVYHSPNYMIPFLAFPRHRPGRTKCVATIHDVIPLALPDHAPRSRKSRLFPIYRRVMLEAGMRADMIISVSNASRDDIIKHLRIPPSAENKVQTIYNGVFERFRPQESHIRSRHQGGATAWHARGQVRNILYVGRSDPYKNLAVLVRAFDKARKTLPFPVILTVIGSPDPRYPEAPRLAAELELEEHVKWAGYLSDDELLATYQAADVLAHPSRYEGFGLQIAEAMACGCPVICSNAGPLPEVAGDAAIMLDPDDVDGLAESIEKVLTDNELAAELREKGIRQASKFTWQHTARQTLRLYGKLHATS